MSVSRQHGDGAVCMRFSAEFFDRPMGVTLDGNQYIFVNDVIDHFKKRLRTVIKQVIWSVLKGSNQHHLNT
jgi:hypothetical protein